MKRENRRQAGKREAAEKMWVRQGRAAVTALAVSVGLLGVCAVLVGTARLPEGTIDGCVLLSCIVGAAMGGAVAMIGNVKRTMLHGVSVGLALAAVLAVSGLLLYSEPDLLWCAAVLCACLCGGGVAGIVGSRKSGRRRN